jgi:hydrogenase maturation protease
VIEFSNRMVKPEDDQVLNLQQWIRVIGIGSHHGADLAGWLACERLQAGTETDQFDWQLCRTPAQLPQLVANCHAVVIVDAVLSDQSAGQVIRLSWPVTFDRYPSICSSHGIGVFEALQLASTLEQLPSHTYLLGITFSNQQQDATSLVSKALPQLQQELNRIVNHVTSLKCCQR